MILGIGSDLITIERIEKVLAQHGARFQARVFTQAERDRASASPHPAAALAKRFAAKEACSKALGTGIIKGVFFKDMEVTNLPSGQPTMTLSGGALARLAAITPAGQKAVIHLSLSDDAPYAQAFVVIEAIEEG